MIVQDVLRRYRWVFTILVILAATWLVADTVNAVIAANLSGDAAAETSKATKRTLPTQRYASRAPLDDYHAPIRERNIFDSLNRAPDDEEAAFSGEIDAAPAEDAEGCTIPITVIGTVPVVNDPQRSMATVQDKSESPAIVVVVQVGEELGGDSRLAWVDRSGIEVIRAEGRRERCEIDSDNVMSSAVSMSATRRSSPRGEGIQRVGGTKFVIDQAEVQNALNNLSTLATEARIVPYFENGQSKGFKLYSIKPSSLIAKVGIMNGDIIQKVNGYEINSPEKALQVYSMLKNEKKISIDIVRNGKPKTFNYEIR